MAANATFPGKDAACGVGQMMIVVCWCEDAHAPPPDSQMGSTHDTLKPLIRTGMAGTPSGLVHFDAQMLAGAVTMPCLTAVGPEGMP